jgi:DNA (cytosine-5)-methyltransferase 1
MSGGFLCQDVSDAGLRAGINGSRSGLVFEQLRLLSDIQPDYAVFENVRGFRRRGLKEVLGEIAQIGYDAEWYTIRAHEVTGGLHERERIFIVAHKPFCFREPSSARTSQRRMGEQDQSYAIQNSHEYVQRLQGRYKSQDSRWESKEGSGLRDANSWLEVATTLCRVDGRVPNRVDRIIALGNAVVPQQVYPILKAIADIERGS